LNGLASVIDTPGVEASLARRNVGQGLKEEIFKQTVSAIHEANLILLVVDAK
jgi:predicted GTPase